MPVTRKKKIFKSAAAKANPDGDSELDKTGDAADTEKQEEQHTGTVEEETADEVADTSVTIDLELKESKSEAKDEVNQDEEKDESDKEESEQQELSKVTIHIEETEDTDSKTESKVTEVADDGKKESKVTEVAGAEDKGKTSLKQEPHDGNEGTDEKPVDDETEPKKGDAAEASEESIATGDKPSDDTEGDNGNPEDKVTEVKEKDAQVKKKNAEVKKDKAETAENTEVMEEQAEKKEESTEIKEDQAEEKEAIAEMNEDNAEGKEEDTSAGDPSDHDKTGDSDVVLIEDDDDDEHKDKEDDPDKTEDPDVLLIEDADDDKNTAEEVKDQSMDTSDVAEVTAVDEDDEETLAYPESFTKLHQLTVNIGPIKQQDLMSRELHNILNLTWNFEIKFEKKLKEQEGGGTKSERPGFVRILLTVHTPKFLVTVAKKLGNLRIDGRDMSVKFPEAFNNAVKDCEVYLKKWSEVLAKRRVKKVELMKRQILVKNVPEKVEEDTIKSMFPEASDVTMNVITSGDGSKKVGSVLLDFESEKACLEFLQSNKDVQIGDCKVKLTRNYDDQRRPRTGGAPFNTRGGRRPWGRGIVRGRGAGPGRGGFGQGFGQFAGKGAMGRASMGGRGRARGFVGNKPGMMSSSVRGNSGNIRRNNQNRTFVNTSNRGRGHQSQSSQIRQSPGAQNKMQSPGSSRGRNVQSTGRPQSQQQSPVRGGSSPGSKPFRDQSPRAKPYPERSSMLSSQQVRQANKAFTMRDQSAGGRFEQSGGSRMGQSPRGGMNQQRGGRQMRGGRQRPSRGGRMEQPSSSRGMSDDRDDDPVAMMAYLKSTLAKMEEKISQRSDYDFGGGHDSHRDSYAGAGQARKRKASGSESGYMGHKRQYGEESRYTERDSAYEDSRYSNRSYDQYSDRSGARGYSETSSYQDNREDYYNRDNRYDNVRQGQGNISSNTQGQRNYGGGGGQANYGNRGTQSYTGNRW